MIIWRIVGKTFSRLCWFDIVPSTFDFSQIFIIVMCCILFLSGILADNSTPSLTYELIDGQLKLSGFPTSGGCTLRKRIPGNAKADEPLQFNDTKCGFLLKNITADDIERYCYYVVPRDGGNTSSCLKINITDAVFYTKWSAWSCVDGNSTRYRECILHNCTNQEEHKPCNDSTDESTTVKIIVPVLTGSFFIIVIIVPVCYRYKRPRSRAYEATKTSPDEENVISSDHKDVVQNGSKGVEMNDFPNGNTDHP